jgi:hypothetical protein
MIQVDLTRFHRDKGHKALTWKLCRECKDLSDRVDASQKKRVKKK